MHPDDVWRRMSQEDRENTPRCRTKWVWIIDDALPSYYRTYAGHEYTWKVGINYVAREPGNIVIDFMIQLGAPAVAGAPAAAAAAVGGGGCGGGGGHGCCS